MPRQYETYTERQQYLAKAYAEADMLNECRERAAHERYMFESTADSSSAMFHKEKAKLFDAICEAIIGGEL